VNWCDENFGEENDDDQNRMAIKYYQQELVVGGTIGSTFPFQATSVPLHEERLSAQMLPATAKQLPVEIAEIQFGKLYVSSPKNTTVNNTHVESAKLIKFVRKKKCPKRFPLIQFL
jgi:hypothetical protein